MKLTPFRVQLIAILLCAVFFRFWHLSHLPGANGDEAYLAYKSSGLLSGNFLSAASGLHTNADAIPNLFYMAPLAVLHAIFAPSVTLMRIVAVCSGLLALGLNFLFCRRAFGSQCAVISTLALAVLPLNIAQSRFGWEPSQSLAITTVILYSALLLVKEPSNSIQWLAVSGLALVAAFIVHATNLFVAPFLAFAIYLRWWPAIKAGLSSGNSRLYKLGLTAGTLVFCGAVSVILASGPVRERLKWPGMAEVPAFLINYERLFSGISTYRYIPGSCKWPPYRLGSITTDLQWFELLALLVGLAALHLFCREVRVRRTHADIVLGVGWLAGALLVFLFVGSSRMSGGYERYALSLVAPGVLLFTRAVVLLMERRPRLCRPLYLGLAVVAWLTLGGFYVGYFAFFRHTGGQSHRTFRTGPDEPKAAALSYILNTRQPGGTDLLVASDWWDYWPLRYLASDDASVAVLERDEVNDPMNEISVNTAFRTGRLWFVQLGENDTLRAVTDGLRAGNIPFDEKGFAGYDGQIVVRVVRPRPPIHGKR